MNNKDRRKNVSFKDNVKDKILLEWANERAEEYNGFSAYIKRLIQKDMEENYDANSSKWRSYEYT